MRAERQDKATCFTAKQSLMASVSRILVRY